MALSPILAGTALLVPVAADWGVFKYVPATVWLLIFVQCLVMFRWRGLWFLLGPPIALIAIVAFLVAAPPVVKRQAAAASIGPSGQEATKLGATDTTNTSSKPEPPLITRNPDGTLTVQKQPPQGATQGEDQKQGLRIPPQVIAPMRPAPNKN
jgi:hypothetical protein